MLNVVCHFVRKWARSSGPGLAALLATWLDYRAYESWLYTLKSLPIAKSNGLDYLAKLEVEGICVVENFWSEETCAFARSEVDRIIEQYPKYVNGNAKADKRVYGANNASELIAAFANDMILASVASAYNRLPTRTAFTLAARMPFSLDNQGSGEGWHRDAFLRQFKAILYLSDVGLSNGPFQLILDSHRRHRVLSDMRAGQLKYMQNRLTNLEIDQIIADEPARKITCVAPAGTLILVDTSTLHRGMPIANGTRYALTNYYFHERQIDDSLYEKFDVLPSSSAIL